jgi:hypothetical protein
MDVLLKFWRLSWQDRVLLVETILSLAFAGIVIAVLPFRLVGVLAARPIRRPTPVGQEREYEMGRVRWAIVTTAARVPWRSLCFQQSLAAQVMLRRRGISSVLYYGAAQDERSGLHAHVWVRYGETDVIGGEIADHFAVLATFPPQRLKEE